MCEQRHLFVMNSFRKWCTWSMLILFGPIFLIPIFYAIFGFPSPDKWQPATEAK